MSVQVVDYHEHSIGEGSGVAAVCYIELKINGAVLFGLRLKQANDQIS
ncbi:hypothetical protein [Paraglaciecola sp.]